MSGTAFEQAIGKPTRRASDIDAMHAERVEPKGIERPLELKAAAAHIGKTPLNVKRYARFNLHTR